ncbi:hypothetical protein RvY_13323 [Ramazzottius varieornatus]|uniref:Chitin-binding type-2 domain-containing protein n=1 Tax=Ramazzottius varieornatus TaxID=947166 RepID=A0A1D1VRI6_RAMVA|nr:hypothetical protein RvY_13323 [Ramazzottius varieornatus]
MRSFILFGVLVACVAAQGGQRGQYVWDLLKPSLTSDQVVDLLINAQPGVSFPNYAEIPQTNFQCPQQPGFYADVNAQCQVFHRCDINGNQTSYLCVNTTIFNQITLVCDYFWNVDCQGGQQYANFANSRLYTDQQLFDTPPADYVAPSQLLAQQQQEQLNVQGAQLFQGQQGQAQGGRTQVSGGRAGTQGIRTQTQGGRTQTQTQGVRVQANRGTQQQGGRGFIGARAGAVGSVGASQQQAGQQVQGVDLNQGQTGAAGVQQQGRSFAAGSAQAGSNTGILEVTSGQDQVDQTQQ